MRKRIYTEMSILSEPRRGMSVSPSPLTHGLTYLVVSLVIKVIDKKN